MMKSINCKLFACFLLLYALSIPKGNAQIQRIKSFGGTTNWYSDDTRSTSGSDLVGLNSTMHGKPGQSPSVADDGTIAAGHLQFVAGPAGGTYGGALKIIAPSGFNSAKSSISTVDLSGFMPSSQLVSPTFNAEYLWYSEPNTVARTLGLKLGIQSTQWAASQSGFTAIRSGEPTWDLILVHLMNGPVANTWNLSTTDKDNGSWSLFRQAGNNYFPVPSAPKTLQQWNDDAYWGPVLFGPGAKITNVQFGIGSGQQGHNTYLDYFKTSILNGGNVIDFVCATGNTVKNMNTGEYFCTIQAAIDDAETIAGHTIEVGPGTYLEDVDIYKSITLKGSGVGMSIISGVPGGNVSSVRIAAAGIIVEGFTITREGNNPTDWNNPGLNSAGISIQGSSNAEIRFNEFIGNRTGIDINNSNGNNIHDNLIDNNRTGLIFRNQTNNTIFINNQVSNNWTVGILFLNAGGAPPQQALNSNFNFNSIFGNWYGGVEDRQSGLNVPPAPSNPKNFTCNWWGSLNPIVSTSEGGEPGYSSQIPTQYGGTATNPGGAPDIKGSASSNIIYEPYLTSGTDSDPGKLGFQPEEINACSGTSLDYDGDGDPNSTDCEPMNPAISHNAQELCNGTDDNCDGNIDEGFIDTDNDGEADCIDNDDDGDGDPDASDCQPSNPAVHHAAIEACNGIDDDCDGLVDDADPDVDDQRMWWRDADGDGYGNPTISIESCNQPPGYVDNNYDCDDNNTKKKEQVLMCRDGKEKCVKPEDVQRHISQGWVQGPCANPCKGDKVLMCDTNGKMHCVKPKDVNKRLSQGWSLGRCSSGHARNITSRGEEAEQFIDEFKLTSTPNPLTTSTVIKYELPVESKVNITLFDPMGRVVSVLVNGRIHPGSYTYQLDASKLPAGIYYYRMTAIAGDQQFVQGQKLMIVK